MRDVEVLAELVRLTVTRIVHFTPARNVPRIIRDGMIRSPADMDKDALCAYAATDSERYDGHPELVSCSIEYPNVFYHRIAQEKPDAWNYPDWALISMTPEVAALPGTLFCRRNASYQRGALLEPSIDGLKKCYAQTVAGTGGKTYSRGTKHNPASPTDIQAEVLVPAPIPLSSVLEIVMPSADQVREESGRLRQLGLDPNIVQWSFSFEMFSRMAVTQAVQNSRMIGLTPWVEDMETLS